MKLNNKLREEVRNKIITQKILAKSRPVVDEIRVLAQQATNDIYSHDIKEWMNAKPSDAPDFISRSDFCIYIKEADKINSHIFSSYFRETLVCEGKHFSSYNKFITLKKQVILFKDDAHFPSIILKNKNDINNMKQLMAKLEEIKQTEISMRQIITQALWSCNTRKQLEEHFPDLVRYLPKPEIKKGRQITLTNSDIKKALAD